MRTSLAEKLKNREFFRDVNISAILLFLPFTISGFVYVYAGNRALALIVYIVLVFFVITAQFKIFSFRYLYLKFSRYLFCFAHLIMALLFTFILFIDMGELVGELVLIALISLSVMILMIGVFEAFDKYV